MQLNIANAQEGRAEVSCPAFKRAESAESAAFHYVVACEVELTLCHTVEPYPLWVGFQED